MSSSDVEKKIWALSCYWNSLRSAVEAHNFACSKDDNPKSSAMGFVTEVFVELDVLADFGVDLLLSFSQFFY